MASRIFLLISVVVAAVAQAQPCTELPVLFVVQDKSGSMAGPPDPVNAPSAPSKWSSAQAVVPSVVSSFANRFRFGAMMFPGASTTFNCTTGTTVSPVPSTPAQIQSAYAGTGSGGGTPTAVSLTAARQYLQSLGLTTPAYVLLITDGMPNCNLALDPATCDTTTAGCPNTNTCSGSSCCGLGAKDCLDDTSTVGAAAALRAAGIPVYVVGFDSSLTSGNNKAVLDAVAAAGGTGSSYVASNQAALQAALSQIAQNTSTCCTNACTSGATRCTASGALETCQLDPTAGCTNWVAQSCPTMSACQGGSCVACSNACAAGAQRCSNGDAQTCTVGAGGCTVWTTTTSCGYGELCSGGSCTSCQGCSLGASRCTAGGEETCDWDVLSGCTAWHAQACAAGATCQGGRCTSCNGTCTAGATRCTGQTVERCVADASGCTQWQASQTCGSFCSGGACGSCGTSCTAGATRCNGNGTETCGTDANNCPVWNATSTCGGGEFCSSGQCTACATSCTQGAKRCGANGAVEECRLDATGFCTTWATVGACILAAGEHCDNGTCLPACVDACGEGSGRCTASGAPQTCVREATGCTQWHDGAACGAATLCVEGVCRGTCGGGELETCPDGQVCTGLPSGHVCLPGTQPPPPDAGTPPVAVDAGTPMQWPPPDDHPAKGEGAVGAQAVGCTCASADGSALLGLLALLGLRRTRRG